MGLLEKESQIYKRIEREMQNPNRIPYSSPIFLIEQLGSTEKTTVRRENYEQALELEKKFEKIYKDHGYRIERIPPIGVKERADLIIKIIGERKWKALI